MLNHVQTWLTDNMLVDSLIVPQCIHRPGSFTGLMTLYESNYIKLEQLTGGLESTPNAWISTAGNDCDLYFECVRRERYTTTMKLTYLFDNGPDDPVADPDLTVRVYHDARLVEAVGGSHFHRHHMLQALAREHSVELDRRWRVNIMLNKWLDYLYDMGHSLR